MDTLSPEVKKELKSLFGGRHGGHGGRGGRGRGGFGRGGRLGGEDIRGRL